MHNTLRHGEVNRLTECGAEVIEREKFDKAVRLVLKLDDPEFEWKAG